MPLPSPSDLCEARVIHAARVKRAWEEQIPHRKLEALARLFKALGDPSRLRIVLALAQGEMCVCDLAAFLRVSESAASHQLRKLRDLSIVRSRRDGQVLYYSLDDDHVATLVAQAMVHVEHGGGT
ncbi:MAG: transcriptional regulator [Deltaproteobacteria bacterium HGW-Deltaproteobacteria-20]|nr:MAG: transcriptional regulator [Deltaproteobacteria bacterium HGW-Deltaproteobacteria-20]